jgi:hypothetical protein
LAPCLQIAQADITIRLNHACFQEQGGQHGGFVEMSAFDPSGRAQQ